jgi:exodeoxyribonuclease V alpha subunit
VHAGEWLEAEGEWLRDPNHGLQFKATSAQASAPTSRASIERYLGSGLIKGIGEVFAKKLVARFGTEIFNVIENESARLEEIPGVGKERRKAIKTAWAEQRHVREIMLFLYTHGAGTARAQRIFKTYGERSIEMVREDPYRLARDIHGIGFRTADEIAGRLGIAPDSARRAAAGLRHVLQEAAGAEGHTALPRPEVVARAVKLLGVADAPIEVALLATLGRGEFVADEIDGVPLVYLTTLHAAEIEVARRVRALAEAPSNYPAIDIAKATTWAEKQSRRQLSPSQREALQTLLSSRIAVLTGGPGVGNLLGGSDDLSWARGHHQITVSGPGDCDAHRAP